MHIRSGNACEGKTCSDRCDLDWKRSSADDILCARRCFWGGRGRLHHGRGGVVIDIALRTAHTAHFAFRHYVATGLTDEKLLRYNANAQDS